MKEGSVTVGRAGRLSVHTLDERALGVRETEFPPSCMSPIIGHGEWYLEFFESQIPDPDRVSSL